MSPVRDPDDRKLRRMVKSVEITLREKREGKSPSAGKRGRGKAPRSRESVEQDVADEAEWDALPTREKHGRRRGDRTRREGDRRVAGAAPEADPPTPEPESEPRERGVVVTLHRGPCDVELADGRRVPAHLPKALARDHRSRLAVGDEVELRSLPKNEWRLERRLERRTELSRPDPSDPQRDRVLVANLDAAVVVASIAEPPFSPGLVDRFLVALEAASIPAALALNKVDLASEEAALDAAADYVELGLPVFACSSKRGSGLDPLRDWIRGRRVAFVGHSGVGKSSLLNTLAGRDLAAIGDVSARDGKGRHTTSRSTIHRLADGTGIVDTPGVREFGLWKMEPAELAAYFPEFAGPALGCRFNDCGHSHEPGCAVREAVERGEIPASRHAAYLRILESLDGD